MYLEQLRNLDTQKVYAHMVFHNKVTVHEPAYSFGDIILLLHVHNIIYKVNMSFLGYWSISNV